MVGIDYDLNPLGSALKCVVEKTVVNFTCANSAGYILNAPFVVSTVKGVTARLFITYSDCVGVTLAVFVIYTLNCLAFQNG
jgi:hypothetical protein